MQPVAINQPVQMQMPTPVPSRRSRYSCAVKSLGIMQIIIAGISAVLGIATAVVWSTISIMASGVWGGLLFYLPAGILGVLSVTMAVNSRRCLAIASLVMSILSAVMAFSNIAVYGWAIASDIAIANSYYDGYHYHYRDPSAPLALDSLLVIASVLELVVSITAAVYCCFVMSEYQLNTTTTVQYVSTQATPQVMVYNQPAAVPYTPGAAGNFVTNQAPVQQQAFGASAAGAQDMEKDAMNFT